MVHTATSEQANSRDRMSFNNREVIRTQVKQCNMAYTDGNKWNEDNLDPRLKDSRDSSFNHTGQGLFHLQRSDKELKTDTELVAVYFS